MLTEQQRKLKNPVSKLEGTLYGEMEAMGAWSLHFHQSLVFLGWVIVDASGGETIYTKTASGAALVLGIYVDDGIQGPSFHPVA